MAAPDRQNALDHVVVVMFENRSFDNLLGRLYQPGEVGSFEGVIGKDLDNPIPEWAEHGADRGVVPYGVAQDMDTPNPDPGEEYQHVNTQLFGVIDPAANRAVLADQMSAPYNAPSVGRLATMDGFVADYISAYTAEMGSQPRYDEYAQIMTGYTAEQMPVLCGLARGFAAFDHWFCETPSQTFTNRSFFHAGTASGYVVNVSPPESFPRNNTAETIFDRLESKGLTWRVYCDPPAHVSFTGLSTPHGSKTASPPTSSPPTSSTTTPPTVSCRPTPSSSRASCTATTTCTRPRTPCSPVCPWTCRHRCSAVRRCWPRSTTPCGPRRPTARTSTTRCS